ncbi:hypothetical protein D1007_20983 [Hordeum vulgare]|nr:hypothetical protein D1007_20983 [Hordeum vulgare]
MALKDAAHVAHKPAEESISSWEDLSKKFIANFTRTSDHPLTLNDLQAMRQRPHEPLRKFVQRFSQAKEGRLFLHNDPDAKHVAKPKGKDPKRKGPVVLAAEPHYKRGCDRSEAEKDDRLAYAYHNVKSEKTMDCYELRQLHEGASTIAIAARSVATEREDILDEATELTATLAPSAPAPRHHGPSTLGSLINLRVERRQVCFDIPFAIEGGLEVASRVLELGLELVDLLPDLVALKLEAGFV